MHITLKTHGADKVTNLMRSIGKQAPFAMAKTLNDLANAAQSEVKSSLDGRFSLRRSEFVKNTIFRQRGTDFATKTKLQATIRTHPERNFLAQHEEGGRKTAVSGTNVAIPLPAVKPTEATVVPKRLRPSAMIRNGQVRKVKTANGIWLVRNRPGKGKGRLDGWRTEFLYRLKRDVPLRPRLAMRETASKTIDSAFVRLALLNIENAVRTAR